MLEITLEHEILHEAKYNVTCDFGKFETTVLAFLGGTYMVKVLLACLDYSSLLPISQDKIVDYTW